MYSHLFTVIAATAWLQGTAAQLRVLNSTLAFPKYPITGPFDLSAVYPLYYSEGMPSDTKDALCSFGPVSNPIVSRGKRVLTGDVPVYIIYYGSGITDTQKDHINFFVNNIKGTSYWRGVNSYGAGNPYHAGTWNVGCDSSSSCSMTNGCFSCNIQQWSEHHLLNKLMNEQGLPRNSNAVYAIIGGTNIRYQMTQTTQVMGESGLCGVHDTSLWDKHAGYPNGYPYLLVGLPKSGGSPCNVARNLPNGRYPNNDYALDNLISILTHELIESIASPVPEGGGSAFSDSCGNEPADKCGNQYLNVGSDNGNLNVSGRRYLVFPIWHFNDRKCHMGDYSPAPSVSVVKAAAVVAAASVSSSSVTSVNSYTGSWSQVAGSLIMSSVSGNRVCGVNSGHDIWCSNYGQDNWSQKPGKLKWISIDGNRACGVNVYDDIYCADNVDNPNWVQISGKLKQIDLHGSYMCGVNSGDSIYCANYMQANWRQLPGGLMQVSLDGSRLCGVNSGYDIYCTDDFNNVRWEQLPGKLKQLDVNGDRICGVSSNDDIFCTPYRSGAWVQIDGKFMQISIDSGRSYGVNSAHNIFYRTLPTASSPAPAPTTTSSSATGSWSQVAGSLIMSSVSGNRVCGVNSGHDIWCSNYGQANWSQKPGKLKWISIDGNRACGTNVYDDIYCADNVDSPNWVQISGKLKQIDIHGSFMCGVNSDDNIYCANYMQSNWRQLPGGLMQVSLYGSRLCGVNSGHDIYCTDDFNNVRWEQLPGKLKQLDVFENTICGVNSINELFCTPYRSGAWVKKDGTLKQVSIGASVAMGISPSDGIFFNSNLF